MVLVAVDRQTDTAKAKQFILVVFHQVDSLWVHAAVGEALPSRGHEYPSGVSGMSIGPRSGRRQLLGGHYIFGAPLRFAGTYAAIGAGRRRAGARLRRNISDKNPRRGPALKGVKWAWNCPAAVTGLRSPEVTLPSRPGTARRSWLMCQHRNRKWLVSLRDELHAASVPDHCSAFYPAPRSLNVAAEHGVYDA